MILITGATGFVGMSLVARLLERDGPDLVLPVRARDVREAEGRRAELLARLYDEPPAAVERLRVVPSDLLAPRIGLLALPGVRTVVHCAASVSFTQSLPDARHVNVGGTANVLDLCRTLPDFEHLVHVSTAYVAGRATGEFGEDDHDVGQAFRNTYEQSKWEAEQLVARSGLPACIVRPSIVVGESTSGWTASFNVIYWPLQAMARGLIDRVPADPAGLVDLVPVDHVVDVIEHAMAPGTRGVLHAVAGSNAATVADLNARAAAILGVDAPALDPPGSDPDHPAAVFAPYFDVGVTFGDERTRAAGLAAPEAHAMMPTLLDYATEARWGKRPLSRQAASAQR